jgi:hypothetical protein
MVLANPPRTLEVLHKEGLIDAASPVWLNYRHESPRSYLSLKQFLKQLKEGVHGEYFVPKKDFNAVPITDFDLPLALDDGHAGKVQVNVLATARPLTPRDVGLSVPGRKDGAMWSFQQYAQRAGNREMLQELQEHADRDYSVTELEAFIANAECASVFHPHVLGVSGWSDKETVCFFPFNSRDASQSSLIEKVQDALEEEELPFFPRDSGLTIANRMRYSLDTFLEGKLLHPSSAVKGLFGAERESKTRRIVFDALYRHDRRDPAHKVSCDELRDAEYGQHPLVSYFPLTLMEFGKGFMGLTSVQTFPVALSTLSPEGETDGHLYEYGLFVKYRPPVKEGMVNLNSSEGFVSSPWRKPAFARDTAQLVADELGRPVVPLYAPRVGKNGPAYERLPEEKPHLAVGQEDRCGLRRGSDDV